MIQMHPGPHLLYNCCHTNKTGVKHQRTGLCSASRTSED